MAWALGTFHAATLVIIGSLLLYFAGGLASTLTSLSTVAGLALFGALWLTTAWSTHRAFSECSTLDYDWHCRRGSSSRVRCGGLLFVGADLLLASAARALLS